MKFEPASFAPLLDLIVPLAIGLLIGTERGWSHRHQSDDKLIAGIRTFGLAGLLGGIAAMMASIFQFLTWVMIFGGFVLLVVAAYVGDLKDNTDRGLTTEIALLLTFLLGSLSVLGYMGMASGLAVVIALLLSLKDVLHAGLRRLTVAEISGALKLLFISLVMLPVLPNEGMGPWAVFNPYSIWWMVVLISALGFAAYVAMKVAGLNYGLLLTALLGGIVSSTAMTLTLSKMHNQTSLRTVLAAGLLLTSALMFPRVLVEIGLVNPMLTSKLASPLMVAGLVYVSGAIVLAVMATRQPVNLSNSTQLLHNPFEIGPALRFALLLTAIVFLVEAGRRYLGDAGVLAIAALSGLTDVDAITLSLSKAALKDLDARTASIGIGLAVISNSLVKAGLIIMIGGKDLAIRCVPIMLGGLTAGGLTLFLI